MSGSPVRCGDCGAVATPDANSGIFALLHFPICLTLLEEAAGVEIRTSFSNGGRTCPRCGKEMTRNHDQQTDTWTWNCTGGMCGVTLDALPPIPGLEGPPASSAFDELAAQSGAVVLEVDDDGTFRAPAGLVPASPEAQVDAIKELAQLYDRSVASALELLREAGTILWNIPPNSDPDWQMRARKVMQKIDDFLPGGIP